MAVDYLDPGPDNTYPNLPRLPDGTLDTTLLPVGTWLQPGPRGLVLIDVEPSLPDGRRPSQVPPAT